MHDAQVASRETDGFDEGATATAVQVIYFYLVLMQ